MLKYAKCGPTGTGESMNGILKTQSKHAVIGQMFFLIIFLTKSSVVSGNYENTPGSATEDSHKFLTCQEGYDKSKSWTLCQGKVLE